MTQSRSSTLNSMDFPPEGEPDFESLFQEQAQSAGLFGDISPSNQAGRGRGHPDDPSEKKQGRDVMEDEQDRLELQDQLLRLQHKDLMGNGGQSGRDQVFGHDVGVDPFSSNHQHHQQHDFSSSTEPTHEDLRAWSMAQASQPFLQYDTPSSGQSLPQSHLAQTPYRSTPPAQTLQSHQGFPHNLPFPAIDPMNYRSPTRDRASLSPQPSPGFFPTHMARNSLTHSLSPNFGPSEEFGSDVGQMSLSAPLSGGGRRLSNGFEGAMTPSYAGSVFSANGLGDLEHQFAGGWGAASDDGAGANYNPSVHGPEQYQELDFPLGEQHGQVNFGGENQGMSMMADGAGYQEEASPANGNMPGWEESYQTRSSMLQGDLSELANQALPVDDGYMQQRIAEYIRSTSLQQVDHPAGLEPIFSEPLSFEELAILTGSLQSDNAGFASQQATRIGTTIADFPALSSGIANQGGAIHDPNDAPEGLGQTEFARRMNSLTSEWTVSSSGNNTPAQLTFPSSALGSAPDGIVMPPFPIDPSTSLADRRSNSANRRRSQGTEGPTFTPTFIKPSPPAGRASLTKQPHLHDHLYKPASPPQLVIPDNSTSQSRPDERNAGYMPYPHQQQAAGLRAVQYQPSTTNGLLGIPSGGNGMTAPYMSPIGPHGPSINIVPSTPTSALREGSRNQGIWENLAVQARQNIVANSHQPQGPAQQIYWNPMQMVTLAGGHPGAYGNEGPRRNSHAGMYTTYAPAGLPLEPESASNPSTGTIADTAPLWGGGMLGRQLPIRQRSRSETDLSSISRGIDLRAVQQALYAQAMGLGNHHEPYAVKAPDSALNTGDSATSFEMSSGGQQSGPASGTLDFSRESRGGGHQAGLPHVVPGPDALGGSFIMTNDGRRIPFSSVTRYDTKPTFTQPRETGRSRQNQGPDHVRQAEGNATLLALAEAQNKSGRTDDSTRGDSKQAAHRASYSEDTGGRTSRKRKVVYTPSPGPSRPSVDETNGSLLPPQAQPIPTIPRARDPSPYSRPGTVRSARRGSNASSIGSVAVSRTAAGGSTKAAKTKSGGKTREPAKALVTSEAIEMASKTRRTADGLFACPIAGCGSTFTRQFNLKGHIRSHNEERPFICPFDSCDKSFARAHDCKRHQQLHVGLKPFQCEGCTRMFARLDALSRHHKTDSGVECARIHPLPTNPDGTLLTETKYKAEMARRKSSQSGSGADDPLLAGLTPMPMDDSDDGMEDVKPLIVNRKKGRMGAVLL